MSPLQCAVLYNLVYETLAADSKDWHISVHESWYHTKAKLLRSVVYRPPHSWDVYDIEQLHCISNWFLTEYYAHYHAFKHVLSSRPNISLFSLSTANISMPSFIPILDAGIELKGETWAISEEQGDEGHDDI